MPIRYRALAVSLLAAAVLATPAVAQERPTDASQGVEQATRIQRQDRERVHQPESAVEARRRSEGQAARDGTRAGTRTGTDGVRGNRSQRSRDTNASRVRSSTRQRARVHRPNAR